KLVNDNQISFTQAFRQSRAQRAAAHFLRQLRRPVARLRSVNVAAAFPERRTKRRDTRATRSFLLPKLFARAGNVSASFRRARSLTLVSQIIRYRRVN